MKKRLLSTLLALCMVLTLLPNAMYAASSTNQFTDVPSTAWYSSAVQYVYEHGMMVGTSSTKFSPNIPTSRGMIVTILHRLDGIPSVSGRAFADVPSGQWYTDAVAWASANEIVKGYGNGNFGPNDSISREQMATILYRYAEYKGYDTGITGSVATFPDGGQTSSWAVDAMNWAVGVRLIQGTDKNILDPAGGATRAQAATILMRFCENIVTYDDAIYTDIEDYFDDVGLTILDTNTASTSDSVQTEAEVKEFLEDRGFGQRQIGEYTIGYPITYSELMNGIVIDETEVEGDSDVKHPLYTTFYLANSDTEDPVLWIIYVLNGSVFAYPASFSTQTDSYKEVIVTEKSDGSIISYLNGKYYNLSANGRAVVTEVVETIDVTALNAIDFTALCTLTGASRIEQFDASSGTTDAYVQDSMAATGVRASQNVPERYGEKFIAIALGDSYISGESISPYIGQYNGRQAVSREDRVKDNDWMSHRSTASWPSRLSIPDIPGTLKDYYVPYRETSDADIQWYFYAISGATTKHYETDKFNKEYTLPKDEYDPFLGRITVEVQYDRDIPRENEVFKYIDDLEEIDYVFMSLGGNDANFDGIVADVFIHSQVINPKTWFGGDSKLVRDLNDVWGRCGEIIDDIADVIIDIHKRAPNATIIQTGYPKLYDDGGRGWSVSKNEARLVNEKISGFNALICKRIELLDDTMDVRFVDIEKKFAGHSAYSHDNKPGVDGAWLNPVIIPPRSDDLKPGMSGIYSAASMHPNTYGADAYAEAVNVVIVQADNDRKSAGSAISDIKARGFVVDSSENPLETVDIYVYDENGYGPYFTGKTDKNGAFSIVITETGTYNFKFMKAGYEDYNLEKVIVTGGVTSLGTVKLSPTPIPGDTKINYYKVFDESQNWVEAKSYCESIGGHLVTITSAEEQLYITNLVDGATKRSYWVGLSDEAESGNWAWVTGEAYSYSNWAKNEPNHGYGGSEHYVAVVSYDTRYDYEISQGEWNDHALNRDLENFGFICEWDDAEAYESYLNRTDVWLEELPATSSDRYTGNMGDSFIDRIGTRNGKTDIAGNTYSHGLEAWVARWNSTDEVSWVWNTYKLDGKYSSLTGTASVIADSYNTSNFDTTLEISGDGHILYSTVLTPQTTQSLITVNVTGVD